MAFVAVKKQTGPGSQIAIALSLVAGLTHAMSIANNQTDPAREGLGPIIALMLRHPRAVALAVLLVTLASWVVTGLFLTADGDVARAIKGKSDAYKSYIELETQFAAPSKDEVLFVQAADLGDPETYAALEDLVIELQLTDGVLGVMSIFSAPDPDGVGLSYLGRNDLAGLSPAERLQKLSENSELAAQVIAEDRTATLVNVIPDLDVPAQERMSALRDTIKSADPLLTATPVGLAALQREISTALIADQLFLAPMCILFCLGIAFVIFRSWRAALICGVSPILGLSWTFGFMAVAGIPIDPLLAIVTTVLIVLAIADGVHVYHAIIRAALKQPMRTAIGVGLQETFPAILLASITTAMAFGVLFFVGSPTLLNLAIVGPVGMALTLVAVAISVPLTSLFLLKRGMGGRDPVSFAFVTRWTIGLLKHRRAVSMLTLVLLLCLLVTQRFTVTGFNLMEHVPRGSDFRETLDRLDEALPGSDQLFVIVDSVDPALGLTEGDRARLSQVSEAVYERPAVDWGSVEIDDYENALAQRVFGSDGTRFALPVPSRLNTDWLGTQANAAEVESTLQEAGLGEVATLASYQFMASIELPNVVRELRFAFYIAVGLVTLLAAVLMRSLRFALLSLVPNLIPILAVEMWLILWGLPLTITGAIALTIAFGIAVDDTIHLLNRLRLAKKEHGGMTDTAMADALRETVPPVSTTSLILLAGFAMTMFSQLPSVAVFGQLVGGAMAVALIADLFLFPALLLWGTKK